jgi:hypothetical protein
MELIHFLKCTIEAHLLIAASNGTTEHYCLTSQASSHNLLLVLTYLFCKIILDFTFELEKLRMNTKILQILSSLIIIITVYNAETYRLLEFPDVKVSEWIGASEFEEEPISEWEPAEYLPVEAFRVLERGSTFAVSQHIAGLEILCNASYPVEWVFDNSEVRIYAYNLI